MDTSARVKLYVVEEGREVVEQALEEAGLISTSVVAYSEARSALARKCREGVFSAEEHREAVDALNKDWETFEKPEVTEGIVRVAGDVAEEHALRGFDAIHLVSALTIRAALSEESEDAGEAVYFLGFDSDLTKAAGKVMRTYKPDGFPDEDRP